MQTKQKLILNAGAVLVAMLATHSTKAQTINPGIIDPTSTYADKTYSEYAAEWWQHYMSLPATNNPIVFVANHPVSLSVGQSGPVWFIGGNYAGGGTHDYTNTIPGGTGLFLLILDMIADNADCPNPDNFTEAELRSFARPNQDHATNMTCTIDGTAITRLTNGLTTPYRVQSTFFNYTCPSIGSVLHDVFGYLCYQNNTGTPYTVNGAVEDGVFLLISPLSTGSHTIHVTGAYSFSPPFTENWTHYLTVMPVALSADANTLPGNLLLSWPQTPDNYTLQASPSLSPPDWQPANLIVITNNGILQATAPIGTANQLFRLQLN